MGRQGNNDPLNRRGGSTHRTGTTGRPVTLGIGLGQGVGRVLYSPPEPTTPAPSTPSAPPPAPTPAPSAATDPADQDWLAALRAATVASQGSFDDDLTSMSNAVSLLDNSSPMTSNAIDYLQGMLSDGSYDNAYVTTIAAIDSVIV